MYFNFVNMIQYISKLSLLLQPSGVALQTFMSNPGFEPNSPHFRNSSLKPPI